MDNETIWINQNLYSHRDKIYQTNSTIDLTVTTNTKNYLNFSSPRLSIHIRSEVTSVHHSCLLSIQNVQDLLIGINSYTDNIDQTYMTTNAQINRVYNNNKNLVVEFKEYNNTKCVLIAIVSSESNQSYIFVTLQEFFQLASIMKEFVKNYIYLSMELPKRLPNKQILDKLNSIENNIKLIPSQIEIPIVTSNCNDIDKEVIQESIEFDKYVEENINNAKIPELENIQKEELSNKNSQKPVELEYKSNLIFNLLQGRIENYESLINSLYHDPSCPIKRLVQILKDYTNIGESVNDFLPGVSEKDLNSTSYISKLFFNTFFTKYLENDIKFPMTLPAVLKVKIDKKVSDKHIELAYDLLLINCFFKSVRSKLEARISDSTENLAVLHIASRSFTDVLYYSIIENINPEVVKNCIKARYNSYKEKGVFDYYNIKLEANNCEKINERDILNNLDDSCQNIIGKGKFVNEVHTIGYNERILCLPPENDLPLEQITNQVIPLETNINCNKSYDPSEFDPDIVKLITGNNIRKRSNKKKNITEYKSNLHRFINEVDFIVQIPDRFRKDFINYISELNDSYDFNDERFPIDEIGDDIIKGLYIWNESENKKESYKNFRVKHENCMSKDLILARVKGIENLEDTTGSESGEWVF